MTEELFQKLLLIACSMTQLQKWQNTHAIEDDLAPPNAIFSECCVCFEMRAPPRVACARCRSSLPVCDACLHRWSWSSGSSKSCVLCRSSPHKPRRPIDLRLEDAYPVRYVLAVVLYISLQYCGLFLLCRTPPPLF